VRDCCRAGLGRRSSLPDAGGSFPIARAIPCSHFSGPGSGDGRNSVSARVEPSGVAIVPIGPYREIVTQNAETACVQRVIRMRAWTAPRDLRHHLGQVDNDLRGRVGDHRKWSRSSGGQPALDGHPAPTGPGAGGWSSSLSAWRAASSAGGHRPRTPPRLILEGDVFFRCRAGRCLALSAPTPPSSRPPGSARFEQSPRRMPPATRPGGSRSEFPFSSGFRRLDEDRPAPRRYW
jgi:hypothetical protein